MQAKIWNYAVWIKETDPRALKERYTRYLHDVGFHILQFMDYHFQPQGYTAIWLLGESHFAVHTFPEFGKTYIELSSCNLEYYQKFLTLTKEEA